MFRPSTLSKKFSALLGGTCCIGLIVAYLALCQLLSSQVEAEVTERAAILLQSMQAVRDYTMEEISPLIQSQSLSSQQEIPFEPEMVPSFAADTIFENFRQTFTEGQPFQYDFSSFNYKEASQNPTQLKDYADQFEAKLIQAFQESPSLTFQQGYRQDRGQREFYISRPIMVKSGSCLQCHGKPADAPPLMREIYGDQSGFGWQLNDVVAAQTIYVPINQLRKRSYRYLTMVMGIVLGIFLLALWVITFGLRRIVVRPVKTLTITSQSILHLECETDLVHSVTKELRFLMSRRDELGKLARAFQSMVELLISRNQDLQDAVDQRTQHLKQEVRDRQKAQKALQVYFHAVSHDLRNLVMGTSLTLQTILHSQNVNGQESTPASCDDPSPTVQENSNAVMPVSILETLNQTCDRQLNLVDSLMKTHDSEIWASMLHCDAIDIHPWMKKLHRGWQTTI